MRAVRMVSAGVVLLALGGLAGAAQLARPLIPAASRAAPAASRAATVTRQVAVTSASRACPPVQGGSGTVALIAAPGGAAAGARGAGQAALTPLPPAGAPLRAAAPISQKEPGVLSLLTV